MRTGLGAILLAAFARAYEPEPPMWPGRFHALLFQNRSGDLGITDLWYDYAGEVNINVIQSQAGEEDGPLWDNERANGSTYRYLPAKAKAKYCDVIDFDVGIIRPDWLTGATFLGEETQGIYECYKWEQGDIPEAHMRFLGFGLRPGGAAADPGEIEIPEEGRFITYWSEKRTGRPVRWIFFDDAQFEVVRFDEGVTVEPDMVQIPAYCFVGDEEPPEITSVDVLPQADE